jgi:RNA polymerase sigma-70 factor, ECF subfamily
MSKDFEICTGTPGPDVIARAQQGDPDAFATLFHAHKRRVYSLCLRMTKNTAEAEELTQDSFLQVFRKLSTFRRGSTLATWVYRIAINTVLNHLRRKSPGQMPLMPLDEMYKKTDGETRVVRECGGRDCRLETSVSRVALERAISDLPPVHQMVLLLHHVEGYRHHEIAELFGCSVNTAKSQLHRARLKVRELLASSTSVAA